MRRSLKTVMWRSARAVGAVGISLLQSVLITMMALPNGFMGSGLRAQSVPATVSIPPPPEVTMEEMEDYFSALGEMRDGLSREAFDPMKVVEKIGNSPMDLRDWVSEHITWVPYHGHQRSPSAVMMDGTGNSLDRAVLLANLLTLAGHKPRLAMAEVSEAWVLENLLSRFEEGGVVREPVLPQVMEMPESIQDPEQRALINRYITHRQQTLVDTVGRVENQLPIFAEKLKVLEEKSDGVALSPSTHWWVVMENEEGRLRLDPTQTGEMEAVKTFEVSDISGEQTQSVGVIVWVQQWKDGVFTELEALSHTFLAPEAGNAHFQVGFIPKDVTLPFAAFREDPDGTMASYVKDAAATTRWVPYVKFGDEVFTDQSFTSAGVVNRDHEDSAQGAAVKNATGLLGALGGVSGERVDKGVLTGVSIEFVSKGGGSETKSFVRTAYQLGTDSPSAERSDREKSDRGLSLAGVTDVLIQTSALRRSYLTYRALNHELGSRSALLGTLHYMTRDDPVNLQKSVEKLNAFPDKLYEFALTRFMVNPNQQRVSIGRPNLISYQRRLSINEEGELKLTEGFDLIQTEVEPIPGGDSPRQLRLEQGMVDAALESVMAQREDRSVTSASDLLERVPAEEWVWIEDDVDLEKLAGGLADGVRHQLLGALRDGHKVLVPKLLAELSPSQSAWWELSPDTGTLVGRIAIGGWGGTAGEYLINLYVAKAAITLLAVSAFICSRNPSFGCIACRVIGGGLIVAGIFAPGIGTVLAVTLANMAVNLGCAFV